MATSKRKQKSGNRSNSIGERGEAAARTELLRPISPSNRVLFAPEFLGSKAGVMDFIVRLIDRNGELAGPFFFVQVKATERKPGLRSERLRVSFSQAHVARTRKMKVPSYLIGVDASSATSEGLYVCGVDSARRAKISGILIKNNLSMDEVKILIFNEVYSFFLGLNLTCRSALRPAMNQKRRGG